ncbi:uncharacterized protein [Coffea arabica]|uniref:Uncharacterized protein isoform X1 n=1 Tax=Coffea arabica TaxID=13443 RepID=A0A6P6SCA6_COFAR|nr:uncharacterized protein LOC113690126 isoform X1 [Coffea arabica]
MRFSRSESVVERSEDNVLRSSRSKKKHKRLDAICENVYTRNHSGVEKRELLNAGHVDGDGTERRRSTRVRRAPEVLDASPLPPKKRRRLDKKGRVSSVHKGKRVVRIGVKNENTCSTSKELEEEEENLGSWRSRLRTRGKSVSFGEYGGREKGHFSLKGRRKLFQDFDGVKEEGALEIKEIDIKEGFLGADSSAAEGKVKVLSLLESEQQQVGLGGGMVDEKMLDEEEWAQLSDNRSDLLLKTEKGCGNDDGTKDGLGSSKSVEKEQIEVRTGSQLEKHDSNDSVQLQVDKVACVMEEHPNNALEVDGATTDQAKVEEANWKPLQEAYGAAADQAKVEEADWKPLEEENGTMVDQTKLEEANWKPLEEESSEKFGTKNHVSNGLLNSKLKPIRIKEGRHCGLCGGGTDGKPPKKLVQVGNGTDDEASSGGSASEEPNYDIWDGFGDELGWLGRLLGPVNDRYGIAGIWVHQQCAVWSPEVYFAGLGCLKNVRAALYRGRVLKCTRCGRPGATIGCRVDRCPKTYHLPCARASGCIFDHRKFLIACTDHRHIFQPQGSQYLLRLKKMKLKKMKLEIRKMSNDALRKDIESEEKWLEQCGEDEEFLKREGKRLHRDLLRIAPTYIGGSSGDSEIQFQGWESVAGLRDVIRCMKEVVILPLLYPEFFGSLGLTPPRGVLLHGYPGTGKTLVVRALIGSCSRGDKRIAYFARKGADCLGKYVGDAERQLRLLFQVAEKSQPSIIFFDEIDGLAPCRTRQQDQTHSSVVSTLLALMDGLKSRGSVVVIGATNRPDAIDPALRRPGRFDREIYFPLPSTEDREAILALHTQKWPKQISGSLLKWVARRTVGFAGADLQALCTQAAIIALRRNYPLHELLSGAGDNACLDRLPRLPSFTVEERDWLDALSSAPPPCSRREAGIAANDLVTSPLPAHLIPCLLQPLSKLLVSLYLDEHVWLPPPLYKAATVIKHVVLSALDEKKVVGDNWCSHLHDFLQDADIVGKIQDSLSSAAVLTDAMNCSDPLEDVADDRYLKFKPSRAQCVYAHPGLLHTMSYQPGTKSGFRILISGEARCGQRHLASCVLHCFSGNIEIRKLDLATLSQEGHGDVVNGLTLILMRCASLDSCMLFLPRIDLWAVETCIQSCDGQTASPSSSQSATVEFAGNSESQGAVKNVSCLWNSFVEQFESICVRTPLMILATSEVPFVELPSRVKQFFRSEMLDCALSNPWKDTMPRFLVEVDQHLNYDSIIDTSATKLLMDLVQYFIHLSRHSIHANSSSQKKYHSVGELSLNAIHQCSGPKSNFESSSKHPIAPVPSVAACNTVKGKSNLLAAISTFGYQILRYPHFAELCWVTSKLKQGPCTHINGPWKGWPFNSCIFRPLNSTEGVAVASSSNAAKNTDKSGVVRGLIAVGLSAYRGEYASLREFSLEIRKVLELLVALVETKIQAGKDKYKFFRLLSQVAYFEDMVISWAYTLRSLEVDAQSLNGSPSLIGAGSFSNQVTCNDSLPEGSGCKQTIPSEILHEPVGPGEISQEVKANHVGAHTMADDNLRLQNGDDASVHKEDSLQGFLDHSSSVERMQSHLQNGISNEHCMLIDAKNPTEIVEDEECNKHSNGFVERDSSVLLKDGLGVFGDKHGMELSDAGKTGNQESWPLAPNGLPFDNAKENSLGCSSRISTGSSDAVLVCIYRCCAQCLVNLYQLLLKLLNYEWRLEGSTATVEDFHDSIASLSVSLQSAVRKLFATDSSNDVGDEKLEDSKYSRSTEMCACQLKSPGKRLVVPMECGCHPASESITTKARFFPNSRHGFDFKYVFKDGVLVTTMDTDYNVPFHCKFEKLCLCSLLECIVTTKDPSG